MGGGGVVVRRLCRYDGLLGAPDLPYTFQANDEQQIPLQPRPHRPNENRDDVAPISVNTDQDVAEECKDPDCDEQEAEYEAIRRDGYECRLGVRLPVFLGGEIKVNVIWDREGEGDGIRGDDEGVLDTAENRAGTGCCCKEERQPVQENQRF